MMLQTPGLMSPTLAGGMISPTMPASPYGAMGMPGVAPGMMGGQGAAAIDPSICNPNAPPPIRFDPERRVAIIPGAANLQDVQAKLMQQQARDAWREQQKMMERQSRGGGGDGGDDGCCCLVS